MSQENDPIRDRLDEISKAIFSLSEKVSSLEQRIDKTEKGNKTEGFAYSNDVFAPSRQKREESVAPKAAAETYSIEGEGLATVAGNESVEGEPKESFEAEIGSKWLGRIGILALVLGVAFFLKYAFENDWIGEAGRVAIGILSGMVLIYLGDSLRSKFNEYAATLTGGGIAVLYLSVYSSFAYYQLVGQTPAFIAMMIITALGVVLAIHYEQINLALLSICGGFLTPLLLSTDADNQIALFGYITILNLGILGISYHRDWRKLNLLGFLATIFIFLAWMGHYDSSHFFSTEVFLTIWFVIYAAANVSHNIIYKKKAGKSDLTLIVLNALFYFGVSCLLLSQEGHEDYFGFFAVLMAVVYLIFAYIYYQNNSEDKKLALFLPGISIFFLTIAVPIQFDGVWVTVVWALEAIALIGGGFYLKNHAMRSFAWALLMIVVIRLISMDGHTPITEFTPILNERFSIFILGVMAFGVVRHLYSRYKGLADEGESKAGLVTLLLMNFLLLWNLSAETVHYFEYRIETQAVTEAYPDCSPYVTDARGKRVENLSCEQAREEYDSVRASNSEMAQKIRGTESTALTILWAFYAIILLAFGIRGKNRSLRLMGISLLGVAIVKFFLNDLWSLGGIYRIVSSIALGVILLSASFAYHKYRNKIKEII